jgi:serine/threonine protein kinase
VQQVLVTCSSGLTIVGFKFFFESCEDDDCLLCVVMQPENLLLDERGDIRITDFGFAKEIDRRTFTLCGNQQSPK